MDAIELYAATLGEVKRQVAQLGAADAAGGDGGDRSSGGGSSSSEGWVVLESGSTPAQLPGAAGCSQWPQQQWQIAYEILVRCRRGAALACRSWCPQRRLPLHDTRSLPTPPAVLPVPARGGGAAAAPG